jgi:hypothetical protein
MLLKFVVAADSIFTVFKRASVLNICDLSIDEAFETTAIAFRVAMPTFAVAALKIGVVGAASQISIRPPQNEYVVINNICAVAAFLQ